ncbi:uncharacterized mitochondrial protein-like protein [Tanacetum coccineum]|uniref:Uncharacterized mitochondrial protein-like protein n=1 Tax=Tanacetum coccineum TaxID=301880 RepID=A0ABQ5HSK6_9ASTR
MTTLPFADTHNLVAFLDKLAKSEGFEQIVKTVNGEVQLQALVDRKKVIITETSVRSDLQLEDAEGIACLPNADIFEQLALMGYEKPSHKLTFYKAFFSPQWKFLIHTILQCLSAKSTAWNAFSSTIASAIIYLATNHTFNFSKYIFESMVKNVDSSVKFLMYIREGKGFSGRVTPLFPTMMVQAQEEMGEEPIADEAANEENVPIQSNDPPLSRVNTLGSKEDRLKLKELMDLCTKLSDRVLDLETTKTAQAKEIASLNKRVKKLERKRKSKTPGMKRLFKIGRSAQVGSSEDEGLGDQEDAFKQGRKIDDIDQDVVLGHIACEVSLNLSRLATTLNRLERSIQLGSIIFGSTKKSLCTEFEKMMHKKFQMSSIGELTFFLGLQVKQKEEGIFIGQDKYVSEILKKFGFSDVKTASTPMETHKPLLKDSDGEDVDEHLYRSMIGSWMYLTSSRPDIMFAVCKPKLGLWYPKDSPFDLVAYTDSDYAGASLDWKSTTGVKNPVFHPKIKHIEIRHHFIRDSTKKKLIQMIKIHIDQNVADLLTKAFDVSIFEYLTVSIGILNL